MQILQSDYRKARIWNDVSSCKQKLEVHNVYISEGLKDKFQITEEETYHLQEIEE